MMIWFVGSVATWFANVARSPGAIGVSTLCAITLVCGDKKFKLASREMIVRIKKAFIKLTNSFFFKITSVID